MTLVPAYGRDYKSKKAVLDAFNSNDDFVIADVVHKDHGKYVNKADLLKYGTENSVYLRYKEFTQICVVKVTKV